MPLAHAGGVDEIAFLLLPAAVFWVVLEIRRKRVAAGEAERGEPVGDQTEDPSGR